MLVLDRQQCRLPQVAKLGADEPASITGSGTSTAHNRNVRAHQPRPYFAASPHRIERNSPSSQIPIEIAASPRPTRPRFPALALLRRRLPEQAARRVMPASEKPAQEETTSYCLPSGKSVHLPPCKSERISPKSGSSRRTFCKSSKPSEKTSLQSLLLASRTCFPSLATYEARASSSRPRSNSA